MVKFCKYYILLLVYRHEFEDTLSCAIQGNIGRLAFT